jgi:hypothetical protein
VARSHPEPFERRLFAEVDETLSRVAGEPAARLPELLRPAVRGLMRAVRPDGDWPDGVLLLQALRSYVDFVDAALAEQAVPEAALPAEDRRWLDACRTATSAVELFEDLLTDVRADMPAPSPEVEP